MDAAVNSAIAHLLAAVPTLDANEASSALDVAVPINVRGAARFLEELVAHLSTHPDAMGSGDSRCPPVLIRLTHVLHDNGHQVIRPGCAHCGKTVTELRQLRPEGRICGSCDSRSRLAVCSRCGRQNARIAARRLDGKICYRCYNRDPERFKECSQCGRLDRPVARLDDGTVVCQRCWKRPERPCIACGQVKPSAAVDDDGAYCHRCYSKFRRPRRTCGRCGKLRHIARNATEDQPDLCHGCYRGPEMTCSICDRVRPCTGHTKGKPICQACYRRPAHTCSRCGRQRGINAHWPMGPVCDRCYDMVLRSPAECSRCRTFQPLIARDEDGTGICGPCAGVVLDYRCRHCGRTGNPYGHDGCAYCVLANKARHLLTGSDGEVTDQLLPVLDALTQTASPYKQIHWIEKSPNARLLGQIVAEGRPVSHDLLDEIPPSRNVHYIRQMMVQTGVLVERHEDLERLPAWLDHHLLAIPTDHANLIRPYLHWFLLRRARRRAVNRSFPASAGRELRRRILVALELLDWLDGNRITLDQLQQDDLDRWLSEQNTQRRHLVRYFLKWTHQRGLSRKLVVPTIPRQQPAKLLDDDERWRLLQRCLTDTALPVDVRAAGALTLLFGLPTERIRHLTADQLSCQGKHTYLTAGRRPALLPPRLATLLQDLATKPEPQRRLSVHADRRAAQWLFPGLVPGQPIANHALTTRLSRHDINVRIARNGALAALAADLPAAVLADLLGMHINTAVRWVKYVGRDWADYIAARAIEHG